MKIGPRRKHESRTSSRVGSIVVVSVFGHMHFCVATRIRFVI
jgi:hypothetical protein